MKTVKIIVNDMGKVEIEASGFKDATCLEALKHLEGVLGAAEDVRLKPEARKAVKNKTVLKGKA